MTTEEEEANRTLPRTQPWPCKKNNQHVVGVQVGGNVIIMASGQIPLCQRVQGGEKERPPPWWHDANNNHNQRCNCESAALAPLSLLHPCPRQHCTAVFAGVDLVSLPSSRWYLCLPYAGVIGLVVLAYLPLLHWCHCPSCTEIFAILALALLSFLRWHHFLCHADVSTIIALASLPLLRWRHHPCCIGVFAGTMLVSITLVVLASLP